MFNQQVSRILGLSWIFLGLSMIVSSLWSIYENTLDLTPLLISSWITVSSGILLYYISYSKIIKYKKELTPRDGFAIVSIGWITMAVFSALPLYISNYYNVYDSITISYIDCYFEAMSGLTTTGASILGVNSGNLMIENIPKGLVFWRSFTHFIGGMGIIVFSLAILPMVGIGGVQLFRAEVAGPVADKLTPRVKNTAKLLWQIYLGLISLEILALKLAGMSWFNAICHSFGTMATGGFSTKDDSIAAFQHLPAVEWIIIIFMFLAATNFSLHFLWFFKRKFEYFEDREFKFYTILILIVSILFIINSQSVKESIFTSLSLITTTGFVNADFGDWTGISRTMIFFLLFVGGCAGSTTGGMKLVRTMLVFKYLFTEVKKLLHPKGVFSIKIGDTPISNEVIRNTLGFYLFYIFIFVLSAIIFSVADPSLSLETSLTASASAIGNIGPGLGDIGPTSNWGGLSNVTKLVSCFCMLLGRLEIFTVIVIFSKSFWSKS